MNQKTYSSDAVLGVMRENIPCTTAHVMRELGCVRDTAVGYLEDLERDGRVRCVNIDGGIRVWIKKRDFSSWISRDAHGMVINDSALFEELGVVNAENGAAVMLPYILEFFTQTGYPLDRSTLMLSLTDVEFGVDEIILTCEYPLNMLCRRDENGHDVDTHTADGEPDYSFTITVKKRVATT